MEEPSEIERLKINLVIHGVPKLDVEQDVGRLQISYTYEPKIRRFNQTTSR